MWKIALDCVAVRCYTPNDTWGDVRSVLICLLKWSAGDGLFISAPANSQDSFPRMAFGGGSGKPILKVFPQAHPRKALSLKYFSKKGEVKST